MRTTESPAGRRFRTTGGEMLARHGRIARRRRTQVPTQADMQSDTRTDTQTEEASP